MSDGAALEKPENTTTTAAGRGTVTCTLAPGREAEIAEDGHAGLGVYDGRVRGCAQCHTVHALLSWLAPIFWRCLHFQPHLDGQGLSAPCKAVGSDERTPTCLPRWLQLPDACSDGPSRHQVQGSRGPIVPNVRSTYRLCRMRSHHAVECQP